MQFKELMLKLFKSNQKYIVTYPGWFKKISGGIEEIKTYLTAHEKGERRLGLFPRLEDNRTFYICCDIDSHGTHKIDDPFQQVIKLKLFLDHYFIPAYIERSKSDNSFHLWIFFEKPVDAEKNVRILEGLLNKVFNIKIEIFPKPGHETGGSVFLPLFGGKDDNIGGGVRTDKTVFVDIRNSPFLSQLNHLETVKYASEKDFESLRATFDLDPEKPDNDSEITNKNTILSDGLDKVTQNCLFIRYWSNNQNKLSEFAWESGISQLCRFTGGERYIHEKSKKYQTRKYRYSKRYTQRKIIRLRNFCKPYTCKTINGKTNFKCNNFLTNSCNVKSPAALAFK